MMIRFATVLGLVIFAFVSRFVSPWPNFTSVLAVALFAGVHFEKKSWAYLVPISAMIISDLFLTFHPTMLFVYGAITLVVFIGTKIKKVKVLNILTASIAGTLLFFLITNFGSWAVDPYNMYPNTLSGLLLSYEMGLPFLTNPLIADLVYNTILFGGFALAQSKIPQLKPVTV